MAWSPELVTPDMPPRRGWFAGQHAPVATVPVASATASGLVPVLHAGATLAVPVATASADTITPVLVGGSQVTAPVAAATADGLAPAVAYGSNILSPMATATADTITPALVEGSTIAAPVAAATADALAPSIGIGSSLSSPVADATADALAPSAGGGSGATAPVAAATADGLVPVVSSGQTLAAPLADSTADALAPSAGGGSGVTATVAAAAADAMAPAVGGGSGVSVPVAAATADGLVPAVGAGATVAATVAAATADTLVPAAGVSYDGPVTATLATATADGIVPVVSSGQTVAAPLADSTAAGLVPAVGGGSGVVVPVAAATADGIVPVVSAVDAPTELYDDFERADAGDETLGASPINWVDETGWKIVGGVATVSAGSVDGTAAATYPEVGAAHGVSITMGPTETADTVFIILRGVNANPGDSLAIYGSNGVGLFGDQWLIFAQGTEIAWVPPVLSPAPTWSEGSVVTCEVNEDDEIVITIDEVEVYRSTPDAPYGGGAAGDYNVFIGLLPVTYEVNGFDDVTITGAAPPFVPVANTIYPTRVVSGEVYAPTITVPAVFRNRRLTEGAAVTAGTAFPATAGTGVKARYFNFRANGAGGGGGSGRYGASGSLRYGGGGGGGGGYLEAYGVAVPASGTYGCTLGSAGTAGANQGTSNNNGNNGGAGGSVSLTTTSGIVLTAGGGGAGTGGTAAAGAGGAGGTNTVTGATATINDSGGAGGTSNTTGTAGAGSNSGNNAAGGGGAGGGLPTANTLRAGGAGGNATTNGSTGGAGGAATPAAGTNGPTSISFGYTAGGGGGSSSSITTGTRAAGAGIGYGAGGAGGGAKQAAATQAGGVGGPAYNSIEFTDAAGSKWLSLSGTYSQSTLYTGMVAAGAANMNNQVASGNGTATNGGSNEYVKVDLGASKTIHQVVVGFDYATTQSGWGPIYTTGVVEFSTDNSTWSAIPAITIPAWVAVSTEYPDGLVPLALNGTARYVRVRKPSSWLQLVEFQVWGT